MTSPSKESRAPRPKIETLSDLIFGLALSIGALTFISQSPTTFSQLTLSLMAYGFSFLILISVWLVYSSLMSVLPFETSGLMELNVVLLFVVSIEPYLFNQLFSLQGDSWNSLSILYAFDLAAMFLILAEFNQTLTREEKHITPPDQLRHFRVARNVDLVGAAIFILSTLPIFGSVIVARDVGASGLNLPLRVFLWIIPLVLGWIRRFL